MHFLREFGCGRSVAPADNTPIVTVVNVAIDKIDEAIALLSEELAEIEQEAA